MTETLVGVTPAKKTAGKRIPPGEAERAAVRELVKVARARGGRRACAWHNQRAWAEQQTAYELLGAVRPGAVPRPILGGGASSHGLCQPRSAVQVRV
jgi:hypothetical protein